MLKSMTGFGRAQVKDQRFRLYCEIKGFNHRALEISFNLPEGFYYLENFLRKKIMRKVNRGRIAVFFNIELVEKESPIDLKLMKHYYRILEKIREEFSLEEKIKLENLLLLPGVIETLDIKKRIKKDKNIESLIKKGFEGALEKFIKNREKAGRCIYREFKKFNASIKKMVGLIKKASQRAIQNKVDKLESAEEKNNFLRVTDINEELNLLNFHIRHFNTRLNLKGPVGKELDFIAQEMQREINTLSAKSFSAQVISLGVKVKAQIEKIREEVQNVE